MNLRRAMLKLGLGTATLAGVIVATTTFKYGAVATNENVSDMGKLRFEKDFWDWRGMADLASSVVNTTGSHICFFEHNGYGGLQFTIGPWEKWPTVPGWINDKISSVEYC